MGEICPKTESYPPPPSQKAKINFNPHSHNDNIKALMGSEPGGGTPIHYIYGFVPPKGVVILKLLI